MSALATADTSRPPPPDEHAEAVADFASALQTLRLAASSLGSSYDDGSPALTEREILERVDRCRGALHVIAACAQFVGKK